MRSKRIISFLLFVLGTELFLVNIFVSKINVYEEINISKNNIKGNALEEPYYLILEIPKLKLKKGLYAINDTKNKVDENIQIIYEDLNYLVLAGHSGSSKVSYFKNLDALKLDDEIKIYKENKTFTYKVSKIYEKKKDTKTKLYIEENVKSLTLVTCKRNDDNNQIFFYASQIN